MGCVLAQTQHESCELARFLLANEFDDIVQLKGGADPAHWPGAEVRQLHSYTSLV